MSKRAEQYSVLFRVAGGGRVGFGHVRRSWTLAVHLMEHRFDGGRARIEFVAASPEAGGFLAAAGFAVTVESHPGSVERTLRRIRDASSPTICVVDDPELAPDRLEVLQHSVRVVCLDDTGERVLPVELVVNGSAGAEKLPYRGRPETQYLLGPRYILLRDTFREPPPLIAKARAVRRVLVLTGGGDVGTLTREVVLATRGALPAVGVDVVIGPFGSPLAFKATDLNGVTVHRNPSDVRELMLSADLAVTGGGQTAYELAATATPSLAIRLADNQTINLQGLAAAGTLWDLGSPNELGFEQRFSERLRELAHARDTRQRMAICGRLLVDGRGTERVAGSFTSMAMRRASQVSTKAEP